MRTLAAETLVIGKSRTANMVRETRAGVSWRTQGQEQGLIRGMKDRGGGKGGEGDRRVKRTEKAGAQGGKQDNAHTCMP